MMEYQEDGLPAQLYLANTFSYFRAPHIYLEITARLHDGRQVLTPRQARAIGVRSGRLSQRKRASTGPDLPPG